MLAVFISMKWMNIRAPCNEFADACTPSLLDFRVYASLCITKSRVMNRGMRMCSCECVCDLCSWTNVLVLWAEVSPARVFTGLHGMLGA